jgi:serine/threonine protein kinase
MIITELMETSLLDIIQNENDKNIPFPNELILSILYQITCGMYYLISRTPSIFHLDLKSPNILVNKSNGNFKIKIIDFGFSKAKSEIMSSTSKIGTYQWSSPESKYFKLFSY